MVRVTSTRIISYHVATALAAALLLSLTDAMACTCETVNSVENNFKYSSQIFHGKVIRVDYVGLSETMEPDSVETAKRTTSGVPKNYFDVHTVLKATIVILKSYKGLPTKDTITVYTGIRGASCGFKFEVNKEYIVYAARRSYLYSLSGNPRMKNFMRRKTYWTSICTRTTNILGMEQGLIDEYLKSLPH